jgi:hypothetical protein
MIFNGISTAELQAELQRREKSARSLAHRRERIVHELHAIESELAQLGGGRRVPVAPAPATTARVTRARNPVSLIEALVAAIGVGTVVSPAEAAERVKEAGYESGARTFGMMVATALAKDKRFRRLSRGQYERVP